MVPVLYGQSLCQCKKASQSEATRGGGNMWLTTQEEGVFHIIGGKVTDANGEAIEDALVEVFDKPDYLLCEYLPNNPTNCSVDPPKTQRRKAACLTGKDGSFCFKKLSAGRYELRVSKSINWNVMHSVVQVDPKKKDAKKGGIEILMSAGG